MSTNTNIFRLKTQMGNFISVSWKMFPFDLLSKKNTFLHLLGYEEKTFNLHLLNEYKIWLKKWSSFFWTVVPYEFSSLGCVSKSSRRYWLLYTRSKGTQAAMPPTLTQFIHWTSDTGNMKAASNTNITKLPRISAIPTDVPSPTGNTHSMINSNTSGMVPLNNSPLQMMEANRSPWEKGTILEQVIVKSSCIITVPIKRPTRISLVHRFTTSADL